ncbi:MAG: caspase family protein, partial [Enhydrobacter sp.]
MKRLTITRRGIFAGVGGLLASPAIVRAQGQNGVALVIGNSKYLWEAQLPNVKRDAPDMAKRFQALGLQTVLLQDASLEAMRQAVEKFKAAASGANLAVFYFAGHGVTWANESYLVPTDTDLNTPGVVKTLIPVPSITEATQGAAHRLLVFDNCRNNPADGWRQLEAHRAATINQEAQSKLAAQSPNTLSLYSTSPGRVALDGPAGENSPFAAALLRQLEGQSVDLQTLPGQLRRDLLIATQGRQLVWDRSTYQQPFAFRGLGSGATA